MTWAFVLLLIFIAFAKILVTCLPTSAVEWMISKFELHPTLNNTDAAVTMNGKSLEGEEKDQVIHFFNEAVFLDKYYGTPEEKGTPIVIDTKNGRNSIRLFLYASNGHINVVKKYKKKAVAYRLRSTSLQKFLY
ncbi:YfmQ family protein [Metabacillus fastidiosus]|uniref:YfmQ family protein n=1 Tax=Metabacillus fastidiosus TaxID=1458 RepID=UPI002DB59C57|nr:YfmQ family protein [Metabacillus fastidiosus]MEC2074518.1 YfmQ family protein [Metabacillus fastidiosus]